MTGRCVMAAALLALAGCADAETVFTRGRIENLCNQAIPICDRHAACVLSSEEFVRDAFPGGITLIVRTDAEQTRFIARVFFSRPFFDGTELRVEAFDVGCGDSEIGGSIDRDLFELAGDEGVIEVHLDVEGRGDHRLELFSDVGSEFLFTVGLEE